MLAAAGAIVLLVAALIVLAWRRRPAGAKRGGERVWIFGLGLAFPAVVLAALLGFGLVIGERLMPRTAPDILRVGAEARRFAWTFTYPDLPGRRTDGVLHVPAGRPVDVAITTADVIHSFWVPRLAGKLDAVPGHVNVLRIEAEQPGTYQGVSAEFSGTGYDGFAFTVVAHAPDDWAAFMSGNETEARQ